MDEKAVVSYYVFDGSVIKNNNNLREIGHRLSAVPSPLLT